MKVLKIKSNMNVLSPLEQDVLKILWSNKNLKVRDIYVKLSPKRKVALTSIAVILDRLYSKNLVDRTFETARGGVRYIYFPKKDENSFKKTIVETTVDKLIEKFGPIALSYFNERFSKRK